MSGVYVVAAIAHGKLEVLETYAEVQSALGRAWNLATFRHDLTVDEANASPPEECMPDGSIRWVVLQNAHAFVGIFYKKIQISLMPKKDLAALDGLTYAWTPPPPAPRGFGGNPPPVRPAPFFDVFDGYQEVSALSKTWITGGDLTGTFDLTGIFGATGPQGVQGSPKATEPQCQKGIPGVTGVLGPQRDSFVFPPKLSDSPAATLPAWHLDDPNEPNLPAGWDYNNKPITMKNVIDDPFVARETDELSRAQQWALAKARISKRPQYTIALSNGLYVQAAALQCLGNRPNACNDYGWEIVADEMATLDTMFLALKAS